MNHIYRMTSGVRWSHATPGTTIPVRTLQDLNVGATLIGLVNAGDIVKHREYTVTSVTPTRVDLECRGKKFNIKPEFLATKMERRVGPVVEESLRKGLVAIATYDGKMYSNGTVLTLTEASGKIFSFVTQEGGKGSIERAELFMACIYA